MNTNSTPYLGCSVFSFSVFNINTFLHETNACWIVGDGRQWQRLRWRTHYQTISWSPGRKAAAVLVISSKPHGTLQHPATSYDTFPHSSETHCTIPHPTEHHYTIPHPTEPSGTVPHLTEPHCILPHSTEHHRYPGAEVGMSTGSPRT